MDKIVFEIEPRTQNNETIYVANIQMSDLLENKQSDSKLMPIIEQLENLYQKTIKFCQQQYQKIARTPPQQRIYLYWNIADNLSRYLTMSDKKGFFLNYATKHFARDLNTSERTIGYLLLFRKKISKKSQLDPSKSWTYYTRRYYRLKKDE